MLVYQIIHLDAFAKLSLLHSLNLISIVNNSVYLLDSDRNEQKTVTTAPSNRYKLQYGHQKQHPPRRLRQEDFELDKMKPGSYSQSDICSTIIAHIIRPESKYTQKQRSAALEYKYNGFWSLSQPNNLENLKKFFGIFNDFFFNGVLGYCSVELVHNTGKHFGKL